MSMLFTFAGLAMCVSAVCALLPNGSLKKTASLVLGLSLLVFWLETVVSGWSLPQLDAPPETLLTETTSAAIQDVQLDLLRQWTDDAAR